MIKINTKSIVDCDENEEEFHNREIENYCSKISYINNYDTAILIQRIDIENQKEVIKSCKLHDFMEMIEYAEIKNGIDLYYDEKEILTIMAYGQSYEINGAYNMVKTKISILPYNCDKEFLNLNYLLNSLSKMC